MVLEMSANNVDDASSKKTYCTGTVPVDAATISIPSFKTFAEEMTMSCRKSVIIKQKAENCLIAGENTNSLLLKSENLVLEYDLCAVLDIEC